METTNEQALEAREKKVLDMLSRWRDHGVNEGWVSRLILGAWDLGGGDLEGVLARLRAKGNEIKEAQFGRWGVTHYRLERGEKAA